MKTDKLVCQTNGKNSSELSKIKASFDFDGTLENKHIQRFAKELIDKGAEVWVITTRWGDNEKYQKWYLTSTNVDLTNDDLREVTNELGIPEERIVFTNMEDKWRYLKDQNFDFHLDDDWIENKLITKNVKPTKGINCFGNPDWEKDSRKIIKKRLNK